jgi:predicted NBD/HSP70 family sugar kinase
VYYVGIDIAKRNHEASLIDADGKLLSNSISFSNSKEGCDKLLAMFEKFCVNNENAVIEMDVKRRLKVSHYRRPKVSHFIT